MTIINTTGITRVTTKLGTAIVSTIQPAANLLEIATESSQAWTENHAAELEAKQKRKQAVREQTHADQLRVALAKCEQSSLDANEFVRRVQSQVDIDHFKQRIHDKRRESLHGIDDATVAELAKRNNLTDADILRAAKVGTTAQLDNSPESKNEFDITEFTTK